MPEWEMEKRKTRGSIFERYAEHETGCELKTRSDVTWFMVRWATPNKNNRKCTLITAKYREYLPSIPPLFNVDSHAFVIYVNAYSRLVRVFSVLRYTGISLCPELHELLSGLPDHGHHRMEDRKEVHEVLFFATQAFPSAQNFMYFFPVFHPMMSMVGKRRQISK